MTAPSVITPRSASKLKKAKQLSGTASASNKSRFMAKCARLWLRRPMSGTGGRCRMTPSSSRNYLTNAAACGGKEVVKSSCYLQTDPRQSDILQSGPGWWETECNSIN